MIKSINIFIQNTNQKHTPNVSQGGSGQVTGVMKLPGVEHLKTVPYYGDVHVLTLTTVPMGKEIPSVMGLVCKCKAKSASLTKS